MTTEQLQLEVTPIVAVKEFVDILAEMGLDPLHLHIDGHRPTDQRPSITVWIRYRTEFLALCDRLGVKPVERPPSQPNQRYWYADKDTHARRLLIQCVSLPHHDDWEARPR